jgi:hypothetical protein
MRTRQIALDGEAGAPQSQEAVTNWLEPFREFVPDPST